MPVLAQLFAADHHQALARAAALDAGQDPAPTPHVDLPAIEPVDLEVLGEVAARAVRFGSGDLDVAEVDLDHELLFRLPDFLAEVLVAVGQDEDEELPGEVAADWAAGAELELPVGELTEVLGSVVGLAIEAQDAGLDLYLWVAAD